MVCICCLLRDVPTMMDPLQALMASMARTLLGRILHLVATSDLRLSPT